MADAGFDTSIRKHIIAGLLIIGFGFGGFAVWAVVAPLNSAAIALGVLVVESNRKAVQHLEGGIIQKITVKEGDEVAAGQLLVRLDDTTARTRLQMLDSRFIATLARFDRLRAERLMEKSVTFSPALVARQEERIVAEAMDLQQDLLRSRARAIANQKLITEQQINQIDDEIEGLTALVDSGRERRVLIGDELDAMSGKGWPRNPSFWP